VKDFNDTSGSEFAEVIIAKSKQFVNGEAHPG
jgi:hypothetical protein